ncbi:MAG: adenylate/guanylate cyclase domain-containing protein [Thermodesulfobacteriota bacterium]
MPGARAKNLTFAAVLLVASCLVAATAERQGWLAPWEEALGDLHQRLLGRRSDYLPTVTIVTIDEPTLDALADAPMTFWGPHFATAMAAVRAAGAKAIGLDLVFAVSAETWLAEVSPAGSDLSRTYDASFRAQLYSGDVVLAGMARWQDGKAQPPLLPAVDYLYSLPDGPESVGLINLLPDEDHVIRRFLPRLFAGDVPPHTTFAPLLARKAGIVFPPDAIRRIRYVGPPGTVPRLSFRKLLEPATRESPAVQALLRDKVVIFSAEQGGFNDLHLTPYSSGLFARPDRSFMAGAEVHANIIETLAAGKTMEPLASGWRFLWLVAFSAAGLVPALRLPPGRALAAMIALALAAFLLAHPVFRADRFAPTIPVVLSLSTLYLGATGKRLTRAERARSIIQATFAPYLADSVLKDLLARDQMPALGGTAAEVVVLFSDIRGFTSLSGRLEPEEVVELLNAYYGQVCEIIARHGGMVDKFIGDAVMALFGTPVAFPDQSRRALLAARDLVANSIGFQSWLDSRFPRHQLPRFRIGVGIHSGKALIGNIGSSKRMEYTAIGSTVNIASRLEGFCKTLGWDIVASQRTVAAAGPGLLLGRTTTVLPAGCSEEISVVEVLGVQD